MAIHPSSVETPAYDEDYYDVSAPQPETIVRLASKHTTEGYRDGITASKQLHVQEGFDEGYILGAALGLKAGELLGVFDGLVATVNGVLLSLEKEAGASDKIGELEALLRRQKKVRDMAKLELTIEKVFDREYFGEDGVWKWAADGEDGDKENERTFDDIVLQHPLIVKWTMIAKGSSEELGLELKDEFITAEEADN
ncbi:hypothetical protein H072_8908 [Dactylellina haptotyla CBS 200.50]|uniref:Protein YAE1 n=1 Tax=Dactylellina haptotyla (strain CBS 200.50) TaxID=1284197 RepID=S8A370_DACHA|nr:hypothetical protein H072_8908 [Dactylellina haptotyla CBS 200.50]